MSAVVPVLVTFGAATATQGPREAHKTAIIKGCKCFPGAKACVDKIEDDNPWG